MNSNFFNTAQLKAEALRLGFSACGIAPAAAVNGVAAQAVEKWLAHGKQADMAYMANHTDKRLDPTLLVEGAKSVISVALNYYPAQHLNDSEYQLAWYAYGKDYHDIMKAKLRALESYLKAQYGDAMESRIFCDTAPVLERYWAWQAGLGWIGKNTQLIVPHAGSTFFLGEIILNLEADSYGSPMKNRCGNCTSCIDHCPTGALERPYSLNSRKCLSYLTIEHRGEITSAERLKMGHKMYGCDDCQRFCPWNRFASPTTVVELHPSAALMSMKKEDWHNLTEEQYRELFKGSAVKRAKYAGVMRNINAVKEND